MRDITHKHPTLRKARARSVVATGKDGIEFLKDNSNTADDPFVIAETAAMSGVKKTPELIPHCHSIGVENMTVDFECKSETVIVTVTAEASEKTGMEMEALTASTIAALNLVDWLQSSSIESSIKTTELVSKSGGYSNFEDTNWERGELDAAVVVASDRVDAGEAKDQSGQILKDKLDDQKFDIVEYRVCPDERDELGATLRSLVDDDVDLIATTGGTGPAPRDVTVEATRDVMDRELPGIAETMRSFGQERLPYAMFSRGTVAQAGRTLIVNFPGSRGGVRDGLHAIFPGLHHFFDVRGDGPEEQALEESSETDDTI
jgi:molybdenum cofactor biosynthesis protein MoaC